MVDENEIPVGVEAGTELRAFADAVLSAEPDDIKEARSRLIEKLGEPATVDAAAVVGNFQRMVRIADSTGIPLDEPVLMVSQSIRKDLGINTFNAAVNSPPLPFFKRILGRILAPVAPVLIRKMAASRGVK